MSQVKLPAEVAAKYDLVNWVGGHTQDFGTVWGTVNITELTLRKAENLVRKGFPKVVPKAATLTKVPADK